MPIFTTQLSTRGVATGCFAASGGSRPPVAALPGPRQGFVLRPNGPGSERRVSTARRVAEDMSSSSGSDSSGEEWSAADFFGMVADRKRGSVLSSTEPEFVAKKEKLRLPDVDWARYNQQVLFVDSSDIVRARIAAGIMEIIANWNGWGMVLVTDRCGVDALPGSSMDPSMSMALLGRAQPLGVSSRHFTRALQVFEVDDLYRYDLIIALDSKTKAKILEMAAQETKSAFTSRYLDYFHNKIAQLSDFNGWCSDEHLLRTGGSALLPRKLSLELGIALPRARAAKDIVRPNLTTAEGEKEWETMQLSILLGVAGFLQFLIDSCPDDLPHWSTLGQHD